MTGAFLFPSHAIDVSRNQCRETWYHNPPFSHPPTLPPLPLTLDGCGCGCAYPDYISSTRLYGWKDIHDTVTSRQQTDQTREQKPSEPQISTLYCEICILSALRYLSISYCAMPCGYLRYEVKSRCFPCPSQSTL